MNIVPDDTKWFTVICMELAEVIPDFKNSILNDFSNDLF